MRNSQLKKIKKLYYSRETLTIYKLLILNLLKNNNKINNKKMQKADKKEFLNYQLLKRLLVVMKKNAKFLKIKET